MKYALRYLWRNKIATGINVSGLAVALAAAFLMLQYLDFELSYDKWMPEHENVYRIATKTSSINTSETYYGIGDLVTETFPEVEASTRFYRYPANTGLLVKHEGKLYNEKNYLIADKGFFSVFPSILIAGNPKTALAEPNSIVMSERLALKLFGTTDVIGKTIINPEGKETPEKITGVIRNVPSNSHFDVDVMRPYQWIPGEEYTWKSTVWTYIRIAEGTDPNSLLSKLNSAVAPMLHEPATLSLQPVDTIHLQSNLESEIKTPGSMLYIYIVVGALILITLIAWINYINLETARFIKRFKEVTIRRIIGATKKDLLTRFLTEIFLVTMISIIVAIVIVTLAFPSFGYITGLPLSEFSFSVPDLWTIAIIVLVVATLASGAYPFFSLNFRSKPVARNFLLSFQFVSSLTLMALVVMVSFQLDFMRTAKTNLDVGNIVTIYNPANYTYLEDSLRKENNEVFRNKLMQVASVSALTTSSAIPGEPIGFTYTDLAKRSLSDPDKQIHYKVMYIDYDFIPVFGLDLIAGRNYSREYSDTNCLVVTESTIRELGFKSPEEALNQKIYFQEMEWEQWTVIGIVKDYRHQSIKSPVNPGIFRLHRNKGQMVYYSVKVSNASAVSEIKNIWKETWPGKPFDYYFMDEHYDQQYKSEVHFSRVFMLFSGVAIFIACLGVMGMSLFEANARIKEIGIRKVLGAEVINIIFLLTKGSLKTLVVSSFIAGPLIYILASEWLNTYNEHIDLSVWFVALPFLFMMFVVFIISLSQTLKAAIKNPVDSLKHE